MSFCEGDTVTFAKLRLSSRMGADSVDQHITLGAHDRTEPKTGSAVAVEITRPFTNGHVEDTDDIGGDCPCRVMVLLRYALWLE